MGTPCVGKTSVSSQLAAELNALHVDLGELVVREKLSSGADKTRGTLIADRAKLSRHVKEIIKQQGTNRDIVVDGHYATDIVSSKSVTKVFVLRRDPEELKQMMEARGFKGRKVWENLAAEILDACLFDAVKAVGLDKVCEVNATGRRVEDVASEIASILNQKKPCTIGTVDWLGKLESQNRLDEFLKEF